MKSEILLLMSVYSPGWVQTIKKLKVTGPGPMGQKSLPMELINGGVTTNPMTIMEMKTAELSCTTAGRGTTCPANRKV